MPTRTFCRHEFVSTDELPPADRFAFWRDTCLHRLEPHAPASLDSEPFTARMRELFVPGGRFTDFRVSASGVARTLRLCRADGIDDIIISLTLSGGGAGWYGNPDRATNVVTGHWRMRDEARPYLLRWSGAEAHSLHVDLPRALFDQPTLERILAANGGLVPAHGLAPMLTMQARWLAAAAADLDPAARAAGLRSVQDLAATVLRLEFGSTPADGEACEDGMLIAAKAFIRRHFASVDLAPEHIARRLGCSRAHLYRVFARNGMTIAGYLRDMRLERARASLTVAGPAETVGDIAFRCGFDNPVHFAKLFRERFGLRPSEVHGAAARAIVKPLLAI